MPKVRLTDRFVAHAKARESAAQTDYFDDSKDTSGLTLRVGAKTRAWSFVFTSPKDGKRARLALGTYPATTLAEARARALECSSYLEEVPPRDPRDAMAAAVAGAMTVKELVPIYLSKPHRRTGKPRRSASEIKRRLEFNALPVIGDMKVGDLHRRDINRIVTPIMARESPAEAVRVFEDLRGMARWALGQGYLDHNFMAGMQPPAVVAPRERFLSDDEIRCLWNGLPISLAKSKALQRIVKLCLVTAQRVGEVSGMSRAELDLTAREWRIPGARTKNGRDHVVPLSAMALELIGEALADMGPDDDFLFPNPKAAGPMPSEAVSLAICHTHERGGFGMDHFTAHDLRRTAATGMEEAGVLPFVIGHVLNHVSVTKASVTSRIYAHYSYAKEKRAALNLWAERLGAIVGGGDVAAIVPMKAARHG